MMGKQARPQRTHTFFSFLTLLSIICFFTISSNPFVSAEKNTPLTYPLSTVGERVYVEIGQPVFLTGSVPISFVCPYYLKGSEEDIVFEIVDGGLYLTASVSDSIASVEVFGEQEQPIASFDVCSLIPDGTLFTSILNENQNPIIEPVSLYIGESQSLTPNTTILLGTTVCLWNTDDSDAFDFETDGEDGLLIGKKLGVGTVTLTANGISAELAVEVIDDTSSTSPEESSSETSTASDEPHTILMRLNSAKAILNGTKVAVDPTNDSVYPFTYNKRTVVPIRFIENLGATVKYNGVSEPVTITYDKTVITLNLHQKDYTVAIDGQEISEEFESAPILIEGKTCVPFRAIAEALGFYVKYDAGSYGIIVSSEKLTDNDLHSAAEKIRTLSTSVEGVRSINCLLQSKQLKVGETFDIPREQIEFEPGNSAVKVLIYSSDNAAVATVSSHGKIKAFGKGTANITICSHNGKETVITVTVI